MVLMRLPAPISSTSRLAPSVKAKGAGQPIQTTQSTENARESLLPANSATEREHGQSCSLSQWKNGQSSTRSVLIVEGLANAHLLPLRKTHQNPSYSNKSISLAHQARDRLSKSLSSQVLPESRNYRTKGDSQVIQNTLAALTYPQIIVLLVVLPCLINGALRAFSKRP